MERIVILLRLLARNRIVWFHKNYICCTKNGQSKLRWFSMPTVVYDKRWSLWNNQDTSIYILDLDQFSLKISNESAKRVLWNRQPDQSRPRVLRTLVVPLESPIKNNSIYIYIHTNIFIDGSFKG